MPKTNPPENETREDRFRRLAQKRTTEVVHKIRVLHHCSNRVLYGYNDDQVNKIFNLIESELKRAKESFVRNEKMPEIQL